MSFAHASGWDRLDIQLTALAHAAGWDAEGAMSDFSIKTDVGSSTMSDPIAFFITWPTYGTWLPGDQRGWVELQQGWQLPRPLLELECKSRMTEEACILNQIQRQRCERQVEETCNFRGWQLHAVNCRSNHIHVVVSAEDTDPRKIRADLKAWCTRRLKEEFDSERENWWADRGSIRWIWNQESLETVIQYVNDAQNGAVEVPRLRVGLGCESQREGITTRCVSKGPTEDGVTAKDGGPIGNGERTENDRHVGKADVPRSRVGLGKGGRIGLGKGDQLNG